MMDSSQRLVQLGMHGIEAHGLPGYFYNALTRFTSTTDFSGKRVLEIGGSCLPRNFLFDTLGVSLWTSVDIINHMSGSYQQKEFPSHHTDVGVEPLSSMTSDRKTKYEILDGAAENINPDLRKQSYDIVISVNALEHILSLERVLDVASDQGTVKIAVETGAGLSTLFILSLGYQCHSLSLPDTIGRISAFLSDFPNLKKQWFPHPGFSEFELPKLSTLQGDQSAAFCFIDGSHAIPSVFSDFCYMNYLLCVGGVLVVDDIQLPGPHMLVQMLQQLSVDWKQISSFSKGIAFRKTFHRPLLANNMESMIFHHP